MTMQNQKLNSWLTVTVFVDLYGPSMLRLGRVISRGNLRVLGLDSVMVVFHVCFTGLLDFVLLNIAHQSPDVFFATKYGDFVVVSFTHRLVAFVEVVANNHIREVIC